MWLLNCKLKKTSDKWKITFGKKKRKQLGFATLKNRVTMKRTEKKWELHQSSQESRFLC